MLQAPCNLRTLQNECDPHNQGLARGQVRNDLCMVIVERKCKWERLVLQPTHRSMAPTGLSSAVKPFSRLAAAYTRPITPAATEPAITIA